MRCCSAGSNATREVESHLSPAAGQTVASAAGQMSPCGLGEIAILKAHCLSRAASWFRRLFSVPDGVEEGAKAGATAVIQPGGSVRDPDVIAAADRLGLPWFFAACGISGIE